MARKRTVVVLSVWPVGSRFAITCQPCGKLPGFARSSVEGRIIAESHADRFHRHDEIRVAVAA